jgi:signal transduction histidine kinase
MLELNPSAIIQELLPRLEQEFFQANNTKPDYVMIVRDNQGQTMYSSVLWTETHQEPDFRLPLLGLRNRNIQYRDNAETRIPTVRNWLRRIQIRQKPPEGTWNLEVFHREGSLESTVARVRWVNFLVSLGLLAFLAIGLVFMYRAYRRNRIAVRNQKDFVASVSHELRTPLAVLRGAAENMSEGLVQEPEQAVRYGQTMLAEADRLLNLSENILLWAGFEGHKSLPMALVDLRSLCQDRFDAWQERFIRSKAFLNLELSPGDFKMHGDPSALEAMVDNLLSNALRHGLVANHKRIVVLALAHGLKPAHAYLEVRDYGPGIPRKEHELVFEAFYRGKHNPSPGIGLGLSLVRRIVNAHGGQIVIHSRPTHGTTFRISFSLVVKNYD